MWTVGLIGLGRVGAGYDCPEGPAVQTHLKACLAEPRLRLVGVADRDDALARRVCCDWRLPFDPVSAETLIASRPDIVCIAAGTTAHLPLLERLIAAPPRLVLCEKPLGDDAAAAASIVGRLEQAGARVAVAYLRRWLPPLEPWRIQAAAGAFGEPLGAVAHYTRGLRNNGGHALDLIGAFFGHGRVLDPTAIGAVADGMAEDPTLSVLFTFAAERARVPVWLHGIDGRRQTVFDLELLFERGRIRIEDCDGVQARLDLPQPIGVGYAPELRPSERYYDRPPQLMGLLWRNLADVLDGSGTLRCSAADALATAAVVSELQALLEPAGARRVSA